MRAVSALSTHPIVATALGETVGQLLEGLDGASPALVLVAVTPPHLGTLEDIGGALGALLEPEVVVGAVASTVVGAGRRVEESPAVSLFAVAGVAASPLLLEARADGGLERHGDRQGTESALVLADPYSCPGPALLGALQGIEACGGLVEAARGPGGSRLLLNGAVRTSGAVGVHVGPPARAVASQGSTPVGPLWAVTMAEGDVVVELGGRAAGERRREALGGDAEPPSAALGLLIDEHADQPDRGALRVVPVLGEDRRGGLHLAEPVAVGRVVRFMRAGPLEVEADLMTVLEVPAPGLSAALLFPGHDRGGDASIVAEQMGSRTAGLGVRAPLAPLAGVTALHGPQATGLLLFP